MNPEPPLPQSAAPEEKKARYAAPALEKGLDILELLSDTTDGYTLNQLAQKLGKGVSQIFRMVVTLERRGYIQADDNDRYTLTLQLFQLAHQHPPVKRLSQVALPFLHELAQRTQQSCHLAVYEQGRVVVLAQVDSPERWSFGLKTGSLMGLTDTSSGHILLAYRNEIERARMLNSHATVDGELRMDPGQLLSMLADVRSHGYSLMRSIQINGVTNIAFPVYGPGRQVVAAINIPHIARIDGASRPTIDQVKDAQAEICERLSRQLGSGSSV
ncbi:MAG: IclR family transcriptional regulator [Castellaniella sp.]|uniref:IclR family transcriptional regulator n=1 Tax=Castellaniella sp. TaxID=1955812 RepID=UPI00121648D9|nr:IclR family transcriptional regulator [Castellaniella sp.]TAN26689.1 MAG: IclR family transcriptional regulator [Castellaniella sp.]